MKVFVVVSFKGFYKNSNKSAIYEQLFELHKLRLTFMLSTLLASFFALVAVAIISMFTSTMPIYAYRVDVTLFAFINCEKNKQIT